MAVFSRQLVLSPSPQWLVSIGRCPTGHRAEATPLVACHTRFPQELECSLWEQGGQDETQFLRQGPNISRMDLTPHTKKGYLREPTQLQVSTRTSNTKGLNQSD